jgi:glycosyltransferase involved in cell wall biosynthesis
MQGDGGSEPISVVIRSRNSEVTLDRVISGLGLEAGDQLLVVDDGSRDGTRAIASRHGAQLIPYEGPFNFSRALNIGFGASRCRFVLAISSHCIPARPGLLGRYREVIRRFDGRFGVACGSATDLPTLAAALSGPAFEVTAERILRDGGELPGNQNSLYRREDWERHPFDERILTAEDLEWRVWAVRNGVRVLSCPDCAVHYRNRGSVRHMLRRGYHDARVVTHLLGRSPMRWRRLAGIWVGATRKFVSGEFDRVDLFRNWSQSLGTFVGSRVRQPDVYRAWE